MVLTYRAHNYVCSGRTSGMRYGIHSGHPCGNFPPKILKENKRNRRCLAAELNNEMLRHTHSVNNAGFIIQRNLRKKGLVLKTEAFCCHRRHLFNFSDLRRTLTFVYILGGCKVVGGFSLKEKRQGKQRLKETELYA